MCCAPRFCVGRVLCAALVLYSAQKVTVAIGYCLVLADLVFTLMFCSINVYIYVYMYVYLCIYIYISREKKRERESYTCTYIYTVLSLLLVVVEVKQVVVVVVVVEVVVVVVVVVLLLHTTCKQRQDCAEEPLVSSASHSKEQY